MCDLPFSAHIALVLLATLPAGLLLAATTALLVVSRRMRFPIFGVVRHPLSWALGTFAAAVIGVGLAANLVAEIASCPTIGPRWPSHPLAPDQAILPANA